ncbi:PEP-CTERM sorting domain-containing protein [Pararobbsia alpina]|nr:PEP-CTERM sorting domain-containing protein [Pararobbsia alpina]
MSASAATTLLFLGSSVTWGYTEVEGFGVGTVTDLNGCTETEGGCKKVGGLPAIFKAFTKEAGLDYDISFEVIPGSSLTQHYDTKRPIIDRAWDKVVMNGQTTLDFDAPGNPMRLTKDVGLLGAMWQAHNPKTEIYLLSTWSRADLAYKTPASVWYGTPIYQMAKQIQAGYEYAAAANPTVKSQVVPVGLAWNRAMEDGIATSNPYEPISPGKVDLWRSGLPPEKNNHYHASRFGSYLEALVLFGSITGVDPRSLGPHEQAAETLDITPAQAHDLQEVAAEQVQLSKVAEQAAKAAAVTANASR